MSYLHQFIIRYCVLEEVAAWRINVIHVEWLLPEPLAIGYHSLDAKNAGNRIVADRPNHYAKNTRNNFEWCSQYFDSNQDESNENDMYQKRTPEAMIRAPCVPNNTRTRVSNVLSFNIADRQMLE